MPVTFGTTARNALRWLQGNNLVSDIDEGFKALASDVDTKMMSFWTGTLGGRPGAGQPNRLYYATDNGLLYYDTGTKWKEIFTSIPAELAAGEWSLGRNTRSRTGRSWRARHG